MFQIISLIILVAAIFYMISVKKKAQTGQVNDMLSGGEKLYIWISSLLNPVFSGAVFYYGWKKMMPHRAKQANAISLWAFLIEIILVVVYFLVLAPR